MKSIFKQITKKKAVLHVKTNKEFLLITSQCTMYEITGEVSERLKNGLTFQF